MQIRTYRARSLKDALLKVQSEFGPDTKVVQTRELQTGWWDRFARGRQFEIRTRLPGPAPLPLRRHGQDAQPMAEPPELTLRNESHDFRRRVLAGLESLPPVPETVLETAGVTARTADGTSRNPAWFELLAELIDAEVPEAAARELLEQLRHGENESASLAAIRDRLLELLANEIHCTGPLAARPGQRRIVALVGPTGVGKTTTIAKLAATYRLREQRRVGLITVDTFRIAAVEQLRTYAEIMDLPMEVVSTPREMREAVARLADQELILIDTAGRSPRDSVQLQQLRSLLHEANADEIQLVMSGVASGPSLQQTVSQFAFVGITSLLITKLDEATGLGNLVPVLRSAQLPVSYLTCGQNVPDDLVVAEAATLLPLLVGQRSLAAGLD